MHCLSFGFWGLLQGRWCSQRSLSIKNKVARVTLGMVVIMEAMVILVMVKTTKDKMNRVTSMRVIIFILVGSRGKEGLFALLFA